MALAVESLATATVSQGTELAVWASSAHKVYTWLVDLSAMNSGDMLTLRTYMRCQSGGAILPAFLSDDQYTNAQSKVAISVPIQSPVYLEYRVLQNSGTSRAFPWQVISAS